MGVLGASVEEALQVPLKAAQQRAKENHQKLLALIRGGAPEDEVSACREVQTLIAKGPNEPR